jgi:HAE1 family hydrophobic/amphiphilic exporter-1
MLAEQLEKLLAQKPEVLKIFSNVGSSGSNMGGSSNEQHKAEITVSIKDKKLRKQTVEQYAAMIKKEILLAIPGLKITATPSSMFGNSEAPIQILLRSPDMNEIYATSDTIMQLIKDVQGVNDIRLSVEKNKPEMHIELQRDKMSMLGLSVADVGSALQVAFAGNTDLQYSEGGTDYNIGVRLDKFDRKKVEDIGSLTMVNSKGDVIELRQFADIFQALGPNKLERYDRISSLTIKSEVYGRPVGTVGEEIKQLLEKKLHPKTVTVAYKGQMERQSEAFSSLFLALFAAILLVYFVMVSLYNSYLYPFVVLFSLPVAMIGALLALALSGQNLSIYSLIGIIMLMGLVAKNAILLVDFTNSLREKGLTVLEALVEAGKERLRPILMTTIAMVFGMLPLATASGTASESKNGLAWAIIGGLISSLLLTLVLVPAVYMTMENLKEKARLVFSRKKPIKDVIPDVD